MTNGEIRKSARLRSWFCPGAGFALLGRKRFAALTFIASLCVFASVAWASFEATSAALWVAFGMLILATGFWAAEQLAVPRVTARASGPAFLVRGFPFAIALLVAAAALVLFMIRFSFGSLYLAGSGMSPTLEKGELVVYHKRVHDERLLPGKVIVYKLSGQSAWGGSGMLVISRILAAPGDQLSLQGARYVINGQAGPMAGPTGKYTPVIAIPPAPEAVQVPEDSYFTVQDSPAGGFDSRVLSWVQRKNIVGTDLYYLRADRILQSVK